MELYLRSQYVLCNVRREGFNSFDWYYPLQFCHVTISSVRVRNCNTCVIQEGDLISRASCLCSEGFLFEYSWAYPSSFMLQSSLISSVTRSKWVGQYLVLCHARVLPRNFLFIRRSRRTFDDLRNLEFSDSVLKYAYFFVIELCSHLGFEAKWNGSSLPTFLEDLPMSSSRVTRSKKNNGNTYISVCHELEGK
jgi:hypothetical protein